MAYGREGAARLAALEDAEGEAARLQAERDVRRAELAEAEAAVRAVRARAAGSFADLVGERLGALAMAGARLEVRVAPEGTGEPVELALGANVGEAVQPLARAASGGELARAMLAIRLVGPGRAPDHGLRRGGRRRGRGGRPGPGRGPARGRAATARCWWSPTWPRWPRRPTRRSVWSSARPGAAR